MGSFRVIELDGAPDAFEDGFGYPGGVAALQADAVLDTHSGDESGLLATQPGDAPTAAEVGEADPLEGEPGRLVVRNSRRSWRVSMAGICVTCSSPGGHWHYPYK